MLLGILSNVVGNTVTNVVGDAVTMLLAILRNVVGDAMTNIVRNTQQCCWQYCDHRC